MDLAASLLGAVLHLRQEAAWIARVTLYTQYAHSKKQGKHLVDRRSIDVLRVVSWMKTAAAKRAVITVTLDTKQYLLE